MHKVGVSNKMASVFNVVCCLPCCVLCFEYCSTQIVAAILSITGIVMLAYADGFHSNSITGVALGVGSASTSAFYKVKTSRVPVFVECFCPNSISIISIISIIIISPLTFLL